MTPEEPVITCLSKECIPVQTVDHGMLASTSSQPSITRGCDRHGGQDDAHVTVDDPFAPFISSCSNLNSSAGAPVSFHHVFGPTPPARVHMQDHTHLADHTVDHAETLPVISARRFSPGTIPSFCAAMPTSF